MLVAIYLALVIAYCIYTICECGWRVDKIVIAGLLSIVAMMCIWELFA